MVHNKVDTNAFCGTLLKNVRWSLLLIKTPPSRNHGFLETCEHKKRIPPGLFSTCTKSCWWGIAKCNWGLCVGFLGLSPFAAPHDPKFASFTHPPWGNWHPAKNKAETLSVTLGRQMIISHFGNSWLQVPFDSRTLKAFVKNLSTQKGAGFPRKTISETAKWWRDYSVKQIERRWLGASIHFRAMVGFLNGDLLKQKYKTKTKMNGSLFLKTLLVLYKRISVFLLHTGHVHGVFLLCRKGRKLLKNTYTPFLLYPFSDFSSTRRRPLTIFHIAHAMLTNFISTTCSKHEPREIQVWVGRRAFTL